VATATLVALGLVVALVEPLRLRAVAAATLADALDLPVLRPFAPDVERVPTTVAGVEGDLYETHPADPAVVLVPGAAPRGIEDRRIVGLAEAVAGAGRTVFIPELEVYGETLVTADVDRIVRVAADLADEHRGPVVLIGASFGGSLALLAAADERLEGRVAQVATFGAYFDLVGVLQAATTGVALVDGRRVPWDAHPRAEEVVREQLAQLLPAGQRRPLERALAGARDARDLDEPARVAYELLTSADPARTTALAERLPVEVRRRLAEVSPSTVADRIGAPVVAMHSLVDPTIPYGELLRLEGALPHADTVTLERFDHVGLELETARDWVDAAGDLRRSWRFTTQVLGAQS
jgi:pimeloyl-ACP methyl ester carboxylesterase